MHKIPWMLLIAISCSGILYADGAGTDARAAGRDVLVYRNGDRVQGRLVQCANDVIEFRSDRFGDLQVPMAEADVVTEKGPPAESAGSPARAGGGEEAAGAAGTSPAPSALAESIRDWFGPWHGRVAFLSEIFSSNQETSTVAVEGRLRRKWSRDEVLASGRYDFSETSGVTTTDTLRADGSWRHDFQPRVFSLYRPALEWNRAAIINGLSGNYLLSQQEVGAGVNLINTRHHLLRVGLSENAFDVWTTAGAMADHVSWMIESAFLEMEWKLPWRLCLSERGVWYGRAPGDSQRSGWENCVELSKKLTEILSASMRHEIRRNDPDVRVQDYARLKLLLGLEF